MSGEPPRYWRSLEQLAGDPEAVAFAEREFPEGASEPPAGITRREILTLLGASLSLAGLAGCRRPEERIVPFVSAPEQLVPGMPLEYATSMPFSTDAYGIVVESHEGRPTKIEGNELHPSTAGASSVWIQAAILDLYDPDRSQSPRQAGEARSWADFAAQWKKLEEAHLADGGATLAILAEPSASPTEARLAALVRSRFPRARWACHEPIGDEHVRAGVERATGRALRPVLHLDRARVILALDADLLLTEPDSVRHAGGFARGRRADGGAEMNRLYAVEAALSLTGANADHRLRLRSSRIGAFVRHLAAKLRRRGLALDPSLAADEAPAGVPHEWIEALADDLAEQRGAGLVVAGRGQPAEVHAAVVALNVALGNVGRTVTYHETPHARHASAASLAELAAAMRSGGVRTLVILGGNPAFDAPVDLDFGGAMAQVEATIHLGRSLDETSRRATWHLPRTHFLESWGDAAAADGTLSVVQPLIAPLFGGRSSLELLGLLATGGEAPGYDLVRETWQGILGLADFEKQWSRVLHDGLLASHGTATGGRSAPGPQPAAGQQRPAAAPVTVESRAVAWQPSRPEAADEGLELVFAPSPAFFDGRFANNPWLMELPDPITKLTWENAILLSPRTAGELGVQRNGDVLRGSYRGREIEAPALIVPGQADGCAVLHLGWGREAAGRIGTGRGFNAYALRTAAAADFDSGLRLEPAGRFARLATTQDHHTLDALGIRVRDERVPTLVREATLDEYRAHPEFAREMVEHPPLESPWPEHSYAEGYQWGMAIDLNACTGCNACVVACQSENNVPVVGKEQVIHGREMHWLRVDRYFRGGVEEPEAVFQPMPCMHCENAPCEQVCPVAATVHDAEGLNAMVYNRCIGTRYCSNNCPYKVRRFNYFNFTKDTPEILRLANNPNVTVRSRGVMEKCTYCTQRISAAKIHAKLEGRAVRDGEVRTACEQACPAHAISFGNIRDPESAVSRAKALPRDYTLLAELNNKPRTTFLAKLRNPHPRLAAAPRHEEHHG